MKAEAVPTLNLEVRLIITEAEARAIEVLPSYGVDEFIKAFYEHLGKHYMERHEAGLRSFLNTVGPSVSATLRRMDAARETFYSKGGK